MEKVLVCQSCGMPIEKDEIIGTNADGSKNNDYCVYCFKDGKLYRIQTIFRRTSGHN